MLPRNEINAKRVEIVESTRAKISYPLPSRDIVAELIDDLVTTRKPYNFQRSMPKYKGPEAWDCPERVRFARAEYLFRFIKWSRGGGYLGGHPGMFLDPRLTRDMADQLETLAMVLTGGKSRAADNWRRALSGR